MDEKFLPKSNDLAFAIVQEPWIVHKLEDGTEVRARLMMVRATDTGQFGADGLPLINFQYQQILDVKYPDHVIEEAKRRVAAAKGEPS